MEKQEKKNKKEKVKSKTKKVFEWIFYSIFGIFFVTILSFQIITNINKKNNHGVPMIFNYQIMNVLTDSMEPDYKVKDVLLVKKTNPEDIYQKVINNEYTTLGQIQFYNTENGNYINDEAYILDKEHLKIDVSFVYNFASSSINVMTHRLSAISYDEVNDDYIFYAQGINFDSPNFAGPNQGQKFSSDRLLGVVSKNSQILKVYYSFLSSGWGLLLIIMIPGAYLIITSVIDLFKKNEEVSETSDNNAAIENLSKKDVERLKKEMLEEMINKTKEGKENEEN
ncbi:MAG: hypothetical protein ACI31G_00040 [Bacilli bacterium]